jgi:beta-galactosidase
VQKGGKFLARFENGDPAFVASNNHYYLACWPDQAVLDGAMEYLTAEAQLETTRLPDGVRLRRRGHLLFALNYGDKPYHVAQKGKVLLGQRSVAPQDVTIIKCE